MRLCNRCNVEKDETLFYKYSGLQCLMRHCKECNIKAASLRAKKSRPRINATRMINYHKNIEKNREKDRNRYWNNPKRKQDTLDRNKKWCLENPRLQRNGFLKRLYGITIDQWESMSLSQNHSCAICKKLETLIRKGSLCSLVVDHCHKSGKVRGLLCNKCNRVMGMLNDDVETLRRMIQYLLKFAPP